MFTSTEKNEKGIGKKRRLEDDNDEDDDEDDDNDDAAAAVDVVDDTHTHTTTQQKAYPAMRMYYVLSTPCPMLITMPAMPLRRCGVHHVVQNNSQPTIGLFVVEGNGPAAFCRQGAGCEEWPGGCP